MEGADLLYRQLGIGEPHLPTWDIFYADDTLLLSTDAIDLQARFTLLEGLAARVGLTLNRDKTVILLGKVKSKATLGTSRHRHINRHVKPF